MRRLRRLTRNGTLHRVRHWRAFRQLMRRLRGLALWSLAAGLPAAIISDAVARILTLVPIVELALVKLALPVVIGAAVVTVLPVIVGAAVITALPVAILRDQIAIWLLREGPRLCILPPIASRRLQPAGFSIGPRIGDRDRDGDGQKARCDRWRRRREIDEIGWTRRQKHHWRRRRRRVIRLRQDDPWLVEDAIFDLGGRRHVVIDHIEIRWWVECGRQARQPAARVVNVRTMRITPQIRPIGIGAVAADGPAPDQRLASHGQQRPDSRRIRAVRKSRDEIIIAIERIARDRDAIGILDRKFADGALAHRGKTLLRAGESRCPRPRLQKRERRRQFRHVPRHLGALGGLVHAQPHPIEDLVDRHTAAPHHLRQRLPINPIGSLRIGGDSARRSVEGDQAPLFGIDERQARRDMLRSGNRGILIGGIEHDDASAKRKRCQRAGEIGKPERLDRDIGFTRQGRIDRHIVIITIELQSVAGEVDEHDRIRPRSPGLGEKVAEGASDVVRPEIAGAGHVEPRSRQCLRHEPGIVGGRWKSAPRIGSIADHQSQARLLLLLGDGWTEGRGGAAEKDRDRDNLSDQSAHFSSRLLTSTAVISRRTG